MENCYLVNILIVVGATEFIIPFNRQAMVKDTKFYRLKISFLMYLIIQTRLDIVYRVFILL